MYEGNISVFENKQVGELKGNKPAPEKEKKKNQKKLCGMRYTLCQEYQFVPGVPVCSRMRFNLFQEYLKRKNKIRSTVKGDDVK